MNKEVKLKLQRNIFWYYVYYASSGISFVAAILILFFQSFNLSFTQIGMIWLVFSITNIVSEIPTGAFADIVGRRKSVVISSIILFIAYVLITTAIILPEKAFFIFLAAHFLAGMGVAFGSGADNAFFYDTLKHLKKEKTYLRHFSKFASIQQYLWAGAMIVGGILGYFSLHIPVLVQLIPASITLIAVFSFYEDPFKHAKLSVKTHAQKIWSALCYIRAQKVLLWIIVFTAAFLAFNAMTRDYEEIFLKSVGVPIFLFGILFSMVGFVNAFFISKSEKFIHKLGVKSWTLLSIIPFLTFLMYLKSDNSYLQIGILILLFIFQLLAFFAQPLFQTVIQAHTKSEIRATVGSVQSMGINVVYLLLPIYGLLSDKFTLIIATKIVGIFSFLVLAVILLIKPKIKVGRMKL